MTRTLYPFQVEGAEFLAARNAAMLYDDPGLGKSTQALASLPKSTRCLIVCPLSVKRVWFNETRIVRPDLTVSILSGRKGFRWPEQDEVVIVNWDILPDTASHPPKGLVVVGDEAHMAKTPTAKRSRKFFAIGQAAINMGGRVSIMTGTPILSWPSDLWGVTRAGHIHDRCWGSYRNFVHLFRGYETQFGMRWGQPRSEVPSLMAPHCLGRKRELVLPQLPVKTFSRVDVAAKAVLMEGVTEEQVEREVAENRPSASLSRIRASLALAKAQSVELQEMLQLWAAEGPCVVFSMHRDAAKAVADAFDTTALDGDASQTVRDRLVTEFVEGEKALLVGTIGAMGVGLTLVNAARVVFIDRAWTPSENQQAEDRLLRIGQTRGVQVVDVVSTGNKVDDHVYRLLRRKTKIIEASVEEARAK